MRSGNHEEASPIDGLMPPPKPWWLRLGAAVVVLGAVGYVAFLWGFGHIRPAPYCCGDGSSSAHLRLGGDGTAVMVSTHLFNSSPADLVATGATADLPGAEVLAVHPLQPDGDIQTPMATADWPAAVAGTGRLRVAVTFRPTNCDRATTDAADGAWGTVTIDLEVADRWHPTIGRSVTLSDPVSDRAGDLLVSGPRSERTDDEQNPLRVACDLLR
jgi:hypothetical protein